MSGTLAGEFVPRQLQPATATLNRRIPAGGFPIRDSVLVSAKG